MLLFRDEYNTNRAVTHFIVNEIIIKDEQGGIAYCYFSCSTIGKRLVIEERQRGIAKTHRVRKVNLKKVVEN